MSTGTVVEIPIKFLNILRCVCCSAHKLVIKPGKLMCTNCSHEYPILKGIPDLRPISSIPLPKIYSDPDYLAWLGFQEASKEYFYHSMKLMSFIQNAGHRTIKSLRKGKHYEITLDLGCGDGHHYSYFNAQDGCFGIDLHQKSLERLKSRFPDYFVIRGDVYKLPIKDLSIDCIINVYNLEHLIYLDQALEEMYRILSNRGELFISVPTEGSCLWSLGRNITTVRKFTSASLNYKRAHEIDHINCIWQVEKALKRHFYIKKRIFFPFRIPIFNFNLVITYYCVTRH